MYCPKCGNSLDLFAEKCLKCGKNFRNLSLEERKRLKVKPPARKVPKPGRRVRKRHSKAKAKRPIEKIETTPIRMTYDNGIAVGEGMSVTGTKQRRGAHRPFLFKI